MDVRQFEHCGSPVVRINVPFIETEGETRSLITSTVWAVFSFQDKEETCDCCTNEPFYNSSLPNILCFE